MNNKFLPILIVLLAIASFLAGTFFTKIQYLEKGNKNTAEVTPTQFIAKPSAAVLAATIGNFSVTQDEVCLENGKPVIYFFGSVQCPHCSWEHPIMERVAAKFGDKILFHNNMDKQDVDTEIWNKYADINQGGIPFLVFGCKYARVGSGEREGEKEEEKVLTALICKLMSGEPKNVCQGVSDLLEQIK